MPELSPATANALTMQQLADLIGPRRAGRPTKAKTVRSWCLHGIDGVLLESDYDGVRRLTTWGAYMRFRQRVKQAREAARQKRLAAVRAAGTGQSDRAQTAREKLEKRGMR